MQIKFAPIFMEGFRNRECSSEPYKDRYLAFAGNKNNSDSKTLVIRLGSLERKCGLRGSWCILKAKIIKTGLALLQSNKVVLWPGVASWALSWNLLSSLRGFEHLKNVCNSFSSLWTSKSKEQ